MARKSYTSPGGIGDPFEFDIDGVEFSTVGTVSLLDISELAQLADADVDSPEGMGAIAELFKGALGPVQYRRFKSHTRACNIQPEQLMEIMRDMVEHVSQGNFKPSSTASAGRPNTNGGSKASSSSDGDPLGMLPADLERFRKMGPEQLARIRAAIDGEVISTH